MRKPRGIALVLVVSIMALAAILGYALLASSSVQATASSNAVAAAVARAQAESGIHLALYELLNDPNLATNGATWSNVTFSTSGTPVTTMPGSVTVQIGVSTKHCCSVIATGSSGSSSGGGAVTRTITAEVQVGTPLQINEAGAFNSQVTVSNTMTFSNGSTGASAISTTSSVTNNNGNITGNVIASSYSGPNPTGGTVSTSAGLPPAPTNSTNVMPGLTSSYIYQGLTYYPVLIGSPISATTTLGPTASNPLGVYYTSSGLSVSKSLTINGTLIVQGTLTNSSSISITPIAFGSSEYLPSLVVDTKLQMSGHSASVNASGVVYVDAGVTGIGTNASTNIAINGALLIRQGAINNTYTGSATVNYNSAFVNVPNFDATDWDSSSSVKIIAWSE